MKWLWRGLLILLLAIVAGSALFVYRLLYQPQGLEFALSLLRHIEPAKIEVSGARGTIAGDVYFGRVVVDHAAVRVVADEVQGKLTLGGLLGGRITIEGASIGRAEVTLKVRPPQPESLTHFLPAGLSLSAPGVVVKKVGVTLHSGYRMHAERVQGDLRMTRWRIDVDPFVMEDPAGRIDGKVFLRATLPLGLRGEASGEWRLPDQRDYRFAARVNGPAARLCRETTDVIEPSRRESTTLRDCENSAVKNVTGAVGTATWATCG